MNNGFGKMHAVAFAVMSLVAFKASAAEIFDPKIQLEHGTSMVDKANVRESKKLDLEIAILDKEIKETTGDNQKVIDASLKKSQDDFEKKFSQQIRSYQLQIERLQKENDSLKSQLGRSSEGSGEKLDIFYTSFMEVGGKKLAEVIVDGSRRTLSVGQEIVPGQRVSVISDSGLKVTVPGGSKIYPLKSSLQIADKLYESALSKVHDQRGGGMMNMAQPILMPQSSGSLLDNSGDSDKD